MPVYIKHNTQTLFCSCLFNASSIPVGCNVHTGKYAVTVINFYEKYKM